MSATFGSCVPVPSDESELAEVIAKAKDYALMHGIGLRSDDKSAEDCSKFCLSYFWCRETDESAVIRFSSGYTIHFVTNEIPTSRVREGRSFATCSERADAFGGP